MSIIIKHQREKLASLKGQLAYTQNILNNCGDELEAWERQEYEGVASSLISEIKDIKAGIGQSLLATCA